ncbi:MAG: FAD-binding protein, partial [Candidatus Thalassarchaeaceae archaeon]|nr:FAD-binding protein [Candidatus Thalassarchaeaceae archaeon]
GDMEFVQFHPTGMIWPPSVKGILVTEGVRGEGGILTNAEDERFMFNYVPEMYKDEFADTEKEALEWVDEIISGQLATKRRPPELLTRDVVAKAINSERNAGRASEHGGAYLDISWRDPEEVKKKLPGMYHQFKELAAVDITKQPMEVGPTAHYVMGGVKVDPETQESTISGLFAAGEAATGLHGANRLGGNSLSDLIVFGKIAGEQAALRAGQIDDFEEIDATELAAVDITKQPMEVGPTAHYVMGGVKVDPETQESTIPGLFAAGEAATGLHGANRLGGNSLSDLIVFGKIAGEQAALRSAQIDNFEEIDAAEIADVIAETLAPLNRENGENPAKVVEDLREMMQEKVGIIRTGKLLEEALDDLDKLESRASITSPGGSRIYNPGWHQALEIGAMIDVSRMCALAALEREESRGGHTRDDFPTPDYKHWGKINSVISIQLDGTMAIEHRRYPPIDSELRELLDADDLHEED